jgi:phospholipid/cholesterol/gamma-HCH transport system ATP-binding protein
MIKFTAVEKSFAHNQVLKGVDLEVATGGRTVLIGTAASGKSVLMKCAIGLYAIDGGRIEMEGQDIAEFSADDRRRVFDDFGMLFQQGGLFDSLTVWENVAFKQVTRRELSRADARDLAIENLRLVGLPASVADLRRASIRSPLR